MTEPLTPLALLKKVSGVDYGEVDDWQFVSMIFEELTVYRERAIQLEKRLEELKEILGARK